MGLRLIFLSLTTQVKSQTHLLFSSTSRLPLAIPVWAELSWRSPRMCILSFPRLHGFQAFHLDQEFQPCFRSQRQYRSVHLDSKRNTHIRVYVPISMIYIFTIQTSNGLKRSVKIKAPFTCFKVGHKTTPLHGGNITDTA